MALPEIPSILPKDSRDFLNKLVAQIINEPEDLESNTRLAALYSVGLLLPRFAGTMLKYLVDAGEPVENLFMLTAGFQGQDREDKQVKDRLWLALDYLRRTGCVQVTEGTAWITDFGRGVFQTRFSRNTRLVVRRKIPR